MYSTSHVRTALSGFLAGAATPVEVGKAIGALHASGEIELAKALDVTFDDFCAATKRLRVLRGASGQTAARSLLVRPPRASPEFYEAQAAYARMCSDLDHLRTVVAELAHQMPADAA